MIVQTYTTFSWQKGCSQSDGFEVAEERCWKDFVWRKLQVIAASDCSVDWFSSHFPGCLHISPCPGKTPEGQGEMNWLIQELISTQW